MIHETKCVTERTCSFCFKICSTPSKKRRHEIDCKQKRKRKNTSDGIKSKRIRPSYRCRKSANCNFWCKDRSILYAHQQIQHGGKKKLQNFTHVLENDQDLKRVYDANKKFILGDHEGHRGLNTYNFPVQNLSANRNELKNQLNTIAKVEQGAFKINVGLGVILKNVETNEFRYFIPYKNELVFDSPHVVGNDHTFDRFLEVLENVDIEELSLRQRPDTKWKPFMLTNLTYFVYPLGYSFGNGLVPSYIKNNRAIVSLDINPHTKRVYDDELCIFRALACHFNEGKIPLQKDVKEHAKSWCASEKVSLKNFAGIAYSDFPKFENFFRIKLKVFEMSEYGSAVPIYLSDARFQDTLYLNLFENHLSYISNFELYAKKYECSNCSKMFKRLDKLKRHIRSCSMVSKGVYPGGFVKNRDTVFEELEGLGIDVPRNDRTYPYFIVYDFEAMLTAIHEQTTDNLIWTQEHVPIAVSVCSNVPEFTSPKCFVNENLDQLLEDMLSYMSEIREGALPLLKTKWGNVFQELKLLEERYKPAVEPREDTLSNDSDAHAPSESLDNSDLESDSSDDDGEDLTDFIERTDNDISDFQGYDYINLNRKLDQNRAEPMSIDNKDGYENILNIIQQVKSHFFTYCEQVPVLSFNGASYDLNLIKAKFASHLELYKNKEAFVIKKANKYMTISTENFRFLDIVNYLAPNYSYASFLKAYEATENKGFMCYDYLDSIEKLDHPSLPPYDRFYSKLKKCNVLDEDGNGQQNYRWLQEVWENEGMKTLKDFVVWYANLDTKPFVEAVQNMSKFYHDNDIDLFKDSISLPGVARRMLFQSTNAKFPLFDKQTEDISRTIDRNICGGPSIIFTREHEVGKTFIRGDPNKPCKAIIGEDFNSLYSYAIDSEFGTGCFVDRQACDDFKPRPNTKFLNMYLWMDHIAKEENIAIKHKVNNNNREVRVGIYPVDGYCESTQTVYEYNGCWYHGCKDNCPLLKRTDDPKRLELIEGRIKRTEKKRKYLEGLGFRVVSIQECTFLEQIEPLIYDIRDSYLPPFYQQNKGPLSFCGILNGIREETLFGFVECDIEVPDKWPLTKERDMSPKEYFSEMAPLFATTDITYEDFGPHMQEYVKAHGVSEKPRTLLVGALAAKNILLSTNLLKWYIDHGLKMTVVHRIIEFKPERCFRDFVHKVCDARRAGDIDKSKEIIANTMKLLLNSAYGSLNMRKNKHRQIVYVKGEQQLRLHVNDHRFRHVTPLDDDIFEVEMAKRKIKYDVPNYLAHFILNTAKLRVLSYYYDCLDYFVPRSEFDLGFMDTDSLYYAISGDNFIDVVRPELREEYLAKINGSCHVEKFEANAENWWPRQCCQRHIQYDKRTCGLMKVEGRGTKLTCLCSKTYLLQSESSFKLTCKGIQKRNVDNPPEKFQDVMSNQSDRFSTNMGFRVQKNKILTYEQTKKGFTYFYVKRQVQQDGVHTQPLSIVLNPLNNDHIIYIDGHSPLSNHHTTCIKNGFDEFENDILSFHCAEQMYLYVMADFHSNIPLQDEIKETSNPFSFLSKKFEIEIEDGWYLICDDKMFEILLLKWLWDSSFREALDNDKTLIVCGREGYWTCGLSLRLARVTKESEYPGNNRLGQMLMELRDFVKGLDVYEMRLLLHTLQQNCMDEDTDSPKHNVRELFDMAKQILEV